MKKTIYLLVMLNLFQHLYSQNLVPNYSFENETECPPTTNQIYLAPPWFQPFTWNGNVTNSSHSNNLFNACLDTTTDNGWGVPQNIEGFQYARTGNGYADVVVYGDTPADYRTYIEVPLLSALITNHNYCVEFYVSLADIADTAISNIGAYFSVDSLLDATYFNHTIDYVTPQVENPVSNMLSDTLNWMLVSGSFTATGGERFMTIGNFYLRANTNAQFVTGDTTYNTHYYIDDVSVVDCTTEGIKPVKQPSDNFILYPNPNNGNMTLTYKIPDNETGVLNITDITGKLVKQYLINSTTTTATIDAEDLDAGIYIYNIMVNNARVKTDKLIIVKQ